MELCWWVRKKNIGGIDHNLEVSKVVLNIANNKRLAIYLRDTISEKEWNQIIQSSASILSTALKRDGGRHVMIFKSYVIMTFVSACLYVSKLQLLFCILFCSLYLFKTLSSSSVYYLHIHEVI